MDNEIQQNKKTLRPCPYCDKIVNTENERHTLYDCRNFLLERYYRERDSKKIEELEKRIDRINKKLGTKSRNLVDT